MVPDQKLGNSCFVNYAKYRDIPLSGELAYMYVPSSSTY